MRGVDEGDPPAPGRREERPPGRAMRAQLGEVPLLKLRPLLRVVAEPLPEVRARRDVREPPIKLQPRFLDTPRPQSLHQKTRAIIAGGGLIGPFELDHGMLLSTRSGLQRLQELNEIRRLRRRQTE